MDSQSYLNEISATVRPQKQSNGFLKSKFFLVGAVTVVALILMAVIGAILSGGKSDLKDQLFTLEKRLTNLTATINTYQPNVKSSDLRSSSASLKGVLSNTQNGITTYVAEKYKGKKPEKKLEESEQAHIDELNDELFQAKINGILDRIYAHKMAYEISLLMSMEDKIYNASNDQELHSILDTSYDSMQNLYDKFGNYSETN